MKNSWAMIAGAGLGAGLMYLSDPVMGKRRRALARDKLVRARHGIDGALDVTTRDVTNRTRGLWSEIMACFSSDEVSDEVLAERVRSQLGGAVSHPSSIQVTAQQGCVTLSGPILAHEVAPLLKRIARVRGVTDVENRLQVHKEPDNVPGLQGEPVRRLSGQQLDVMQTYWSPTTRLLMGATGGTLAVYGANRRDVGGTAISLLGLTLLARALTNVELRRLLGVGAGRRAIDIQKTININAPVERVFALWADYKNFPRFMSNVREVKDLGDGRSHWIVAGPAGVPVEWDAVITSYTPNEVLAWKTEPSSIVQHAGIIHFQPNPDGSTAVNIRLTYNPGAGGLGHVAASVFGADPKSEMDEDLVRMKTFIETGKTPSDAAMAHRG